LTVAGLADYLDARRVAEDRCQSLADDLLVVYEQDADGTYDSPTSRRQPDCILEFS
jgi:hypothetical protein